MSIRKPEQSALGVCSVCHDPVVGWVYFQWNGVEFDDLDWGWSHFEHPADGHDAVPEP